LNPSILAEPRQPGLRSLVLVVGALLIIPGATLVSDHYPPWLAFHSEAVALVGLALLFVGIVPRRPDGLQVPWPALFTFALALLPWVQWMAGVNPYMGDALLSSLYLCALGVAIAAGHELARRNGSDPRVSTWVFALCVFSATASAAIGAIQWFGLTNSAGPLVVDVDAGTRAVGNVAQANHLGTICLLGICGLAYLFHVRLIGAWALLLGVAFLSAATALTQSRTSIVAVVCLATAYLIYRKRAELRIARTAVAAWVLLYVVTWLLVPAAARLLLLGGGREDAIAADNGRWELWTQTWAGILQRFWTGYGWNQTMAAHIAGATEVPGRLTAAYAHNGLLDLAAWIGIPGALLVLGVMGYWLWRRFRAPGSGAGVHTVLCLMPLLVHSLVEYPFAYAYFLIPAGLAVGWMSFGWGAIRIPSGMAVLGLALATTVAARVAVEYLAVEEEFRAVRFSEARIGVPVPVGQAPQLLLNTQLAAMLKAARTLPAPGMSREELDSLLAVCRRYAYSALTFRCAAAAALNGDPQQAEAMMRSFRGLYGEKAYAIAAGKLERLAEDSSRPAPSDAP